MARGNDAKAEVVRRLQEAFGEDYIGEFDKKFYVWANEGGEKLQIAIALTCPKTLVAVSASPVGNTLDFTATPTQQQVEITEDEKARLNALMQKLGL